MITLIIIFLTLYVINIIYITKKSGSWVDFNPTDSNVVSFLYYVLGTAIIIVLVVVSIVLLCIKYLP